MNQKLSDLVCWDGNFHTNVEVNILLTSTNLIETKMNSKQILLALAFIVIGAILAVYLYDIFNCIYTDSPIPAAELGTFLVLLIGTSSLVVTFRKELGSFGKKM